MAAQFHDGPGQPPAVPGPRPHLNPPKRCDICFLEDINEPLFACCAFNAAAAFIDPAISQLVTELRECRLYIFELLCFLLGRQTGRFSRAPASKQP